MQSLSRVQLFATQWTGPGHPVHHQLPEFIQTHVHWVSDAIQTSHPVGLLFLPSMLPNIRDFANESVLHIRWPKYWSYSFSINPSKNIQDWFPLGLTGWISLLPKGLSRVFSNTTVQKDQFFGSQLSYTRRGEKEENIQGIETRLYKD